MINLHAIAKHQERVRPMRDPATVHWRVVSGAQSRLAQKAGVVAWYSAASDTVCVPEHFAPMAGEAMYAPTITHELCHAAQRKRMGLILYTLAKTFMRGKLEDEAIMEEMRAQYILKSHVL